VNEQAARSITTHGRSFLADALVVIEEQRACRRRAGERCTRMPCRKRPEHQCSSGLGMLRVGEAGSRNIAMLKGSVIAMERIS